MVRRWGLDPRLACLLVSLDLSAAQHLRCRGLDWPGLWIISGARTEPLEPALNPGQAAATASLHLTTPARAADLRVGNAPASTTDPSVWAFLGTLGKALGLRWGGLFDPPDPNHFDLGR